MIITPRDRRQKTIPGCIKRGLTLQEIADEHGITVGSLRRECGEGGIDISTVGKTCAVCGVGGKLERYRGKWYCGEHLLTAGDHNPYYEEEQRQAAFEGHTESALARAPEMMGSKRDGHPVDLSKALDRAMEREGILRRKMVPDWVVPKDLATLGPHKTGGER